MSFKVIIIVSSGNQPFVEEKSVHDNKVSWEIIQRIF